MSVCSLSGYVAEPSIFTVLVAARQHLVVARFSARDGTELAYRVQGRGTAVVCLPGGPMRDSVYLGDLGGLAARCQVIVLDLRGTGRSAAPADHASYRCDRVVEDVEVLRETLRLDSMHLLGHSAGASLALQYAARYPGRVGSLLLITPSTRALGLAATDAARQEIMQLRRNEPWFAAAAAAFERISADEEREDDWGAIAPFGYGRWDAAAQAHCAAQDDQINDEAAEEFNADGAYDPAATRAALAALDVPVLVLAGSLDLVTPPALAAALAAMCRRADLVVQHGAGHFPWLDDRRAFVSAVTAFLARNSGS
jgi:proline iminopeptidase